MKWCDGVGRGSLTGKEGAGSSASSAISAIAACAFRREAQTGCQRRILHHFPR